MWWPDAGGAGPARPLSEKFKPGDIICRYKRNRDKWYSFMTRLICFFTREWWYREKATTVYHAEMVHHYDEATQRWQAVTMEPPKCRVRKMPKTRYIVFRLRDRNSNFDEKFAVYVNERLGQKYDFMKIFAHVLNWIFRTRWFSRKVFRDSDRDICSEFVARFYNNVLYYPCSPFKADTTTPDDIYDFCSKMAHFEKIAEVKPA